MDNVSCMRPAYRLRTSARGIFSDAKMALLPGHLRGLTGISAFVSPANR